MFEKEVVVDCRGHLMGRLASVVAKELLNGQKVVLVRTEEMNISGSLYRNKLKWTEFLRKRTNTNPKRGPIHQRSPSRMVFRVIRGMVAHKTPRGQAALGRLKAFEGIPHPFDKVKRKVIPAALRVTRLKPGRHFCQIGQLASEVGWKHFDLIKRLEANRKTRAASFFLKKREGARLVAKASA